jgi:hypothetical protein
MTRRLQLACVGLCAFLFSACSGNSGPSDPYHTGGPGVVLMERQGIKPAYYRQPGQDATAYSGAQAVADPKYGPIVPVQPVVQADQQQNYLNQSNEITITQMPPKNLPRISVDSPLTAPSPPESLQIAKPVGSPLVLANPADPTRYPEWPLIGGQRIVEGPATRSPDLLPKLEPAIDSPMSPIVPTLTAPMIGVAPPLDAVQLPSNNVSMKVPDPRTTVMSHDIQPMAAPAVALNNETILVQAIKAFQANRPEEAIGCLKKLDSTNQELLMSLMPLIVRLGEGNINAMPPEETAMLIDRLQTAAGMLKSKAALGAEHVCFCRGVRKFSDVDPYEPRHEFQPGDMVFLYAELKNFTCEPLANNRAVNAPAQKSFAIRLGATLELRDLRNALIWRTDLAKTDFAQTPPQDYYHTYRFCVPESLPAGTYTLWLMIVDKPTGRTVRKPIEMRVRQS